MLAYINIILFLAFLTGNDQNFDQKVVKDLKKINEAYLRTSNLYMDFECRIFQKENSTNYKEIEKGSLLLSRDNYYSKTTSREVYQNEEKQLVFDHSIKTAYLNPVVRAKKRKAIQINIDSSLKVCKEVKKLSGSGACKVIYKNGPIASMDIYYNEKNFFLSRVVIYYSSPIPESAYDKFPPVMELKYSNVKVLSAAKANEYNIKNIVKNKKGKYVLSDKYKGYKLKNSLK